MLVLPLASWLLIGIDAAWWGRPQLGSRGMARLRIVRHRGRRRDPLARSWPRRLSPARLRFGTRGSLVLQAAIFAPKVLQRARLRVRSTRLSRQPGEEPSPSDCPPR